MIELLFALVALFGDVVATLVAFLIGVGAAALGLVVILFAALVAAQLIAGFFSRG